MKDALPAQMDIAVELQVHEETQQCRDALTEHGCVGGACDAEPGETEKAEDHDRVENDVDDRAGGLADHAQLRAPGRLQKSLKGHLEEKAERETGHDRQVSVAVRDDLCGGFACAAAQLNGYGPVGAEKSEEQKCYETAEREKNAHVGGGVGFVEPLFSQRAGEKGVHTDAGTGADRNHQILQRESIGDGRERILSEPCHEDTVNDVVKGLHEHGDHHGECHADDQSFDRHYAHLVFFGISVGCQDSFSFVVFYS